MKKTLLAITAVALLASCKNTKFSGYDEVEGGSYFKMDKAGDGKIAVNNGDVVFVHLTITTDKDSILYDYKTMSEPGRSGYPMRLSNPVYKGDVSEVLMKMHVGDSASFMLRTDSLFEKSYKQPLPKYLDPKGYIVYHLKIDSLYNTAKVQQIEEKNRQMQLAYMQKMAGMEDSLLNKYIADNKITVKPTESGLYMIEKQKGKGQQVKLGDYVEMKYKGMLLTGEVFDASEMHDQPLIFPVGTQGIIAAWNEAALKMAVGSKATLVVPSKVGYGPRGHGRIPPYTPMVFEIEVVAIKPPPPAPPAGK